MTNHAQGLDAIVVLIQMVCMQDPGEFHPRSSDSGFTLFDRRTRLFAMARRALLARLAVADLDPTITHVVTSEILPHVERVERGQLAVTRFEGMDPTLARALVQRAGIEEAPLRGTQSSRIAHEEMARDRAAGRLTIQALETGLLEDVEHAHLVLALIPTLPEAIVGWPLRANHSYQDIPRPLDAGERIARVEEIERVLWWLATGVPPRANESWRRTYAFFEAGVWLDAAATGGTLLI